MIYTDATGHDYMRDPLKVDEFCALCCFPCADHRLPKAETIKDYLTLDKHTYGRIVKRHSDKKYFFELWQLMKVGWHPLTVGEQSGRFSDALDRFHSWKQTDPLPGFCVGHGAIE